MQSQQAQEAAQAASQAKQQEMQIEAQLEAQKIQLKAQAEIQVAQALHELHKEIEIIKAQATLGFKEDDQNFKEKIEVFKEDRKDDRALTQSRQQSSLMKEKQMMDSKMSLMDKEVDTDKLLNTTNQ